MHQDGVLVVGRERTRRRLSSGGRVPDEVCRIWINVVGGWVG